MQHCCFAPSQVEYEKMFENSFSEKCQDITFSGTFVSNAACALDMALAKSQMFSFILDQRQTLLSFRFPYPSKTTCVNVMNGDGSGSELKTYGNNNVPLDTRIHHFRLIASQPKAITFRIV